MKFIKVTAKTYREWSFGPALGRALRKIAERNPNALVISVAIRVDDTLWEWVFKDEKEEKG